MKNWRRSVSIAPGDIVDCGEVPGNLLLVVDGANLVLTWETGALPEGWLLQLLHPPDPPTIIIDTGLSGDTLEITVPWPEPGDFQWRLRDSGSPASCWVYSNIVNVPD